MNIYNTNTPGIRSNVTRLVNTENSEYQSLRLNMGKFQKNKVSKYRGPAGPAPMIISATALQPFRPACFVDNISAINSATIDQDIIPGFQSFKRTKAAGTLPVPTLPVICYKARQTDTVVLKIEHPSNFTLCGHVCINPLLGAIHVFGSHVVQPTVMYSSKDRAFSLSTSLDGICSEEDLKARLLEDEILAPKHVGEFFDKLDVKKHVILMVSSVYTPPLFHAKQYLKFNLEPTTNDSFSLVPLLKTVAKCTIDVEGSKHYTSYQMPSDWTDLSIAARTVVVGGKSAGKSTLCKFLVNRLLNCNCAVLYVECDIGQGEFSPPGCVAAYLLTEPVLGPNFFHQRTPLKMLFLGEVDAVRCHDNYLMAVQYLINEVAVPEYSNIPWIVNTMGFCQGLGFHLNSRVIQTVGPTTVIQLQVEADPKRNFKHYLTPERVADQTPLTYDLILMKSVCSDTKRSKLTGRGDRELKLISHLSPMLTAPHYSFNDAQPYSIKFSDLYIGISANIAACDALRVLNGALVGLCEVPLPTDRVLHCTEDSKSEWFKIVIKPALQPCVELGLVRGVDMDRKEVHVLTTVPVGKLEKVRMLVVGNVDVPPLIMTAQCDVTGTIPYIANSTHSRRFSTVRRVHSPRPPRANDSFERVAT